MRLSRSAPQLFVTLHEHPWFRHRHIWDKPQTVADRLFAILARQYPVPLSLPLEIFRRHCGIHVHHEWHKSILIDYGVPESLVRVIPHPVPACRASPQTVDGFRQRFNLVGKRILAMTGFIFERKRYERVLNLLPQLPDDVIICLLGGATGQSSELYLAQLVRIAEGLGVRSRLVVTGYLPGQDMNAGLLATDLFVAPYGEVSSSGSVARCIAAGAPIVAGQCPTFDELSEGGAGLVCVDAESPEALLSEIKRVLGDNEARGWMIAKNRSYAERHSLGRIAEVFQAWYRECLGTRGLHH